jgi:hypothetical protein
MKRLIMLIVVVGLVACATEALETGSELIKVTGQLTDPEGEAVDPGVYEVMFSVFEKPKGGNPLWKTIMFVEVGPGGMFSALLGPIGIDVFTDPKYPEEPQLRYLEMQAVEDDPISPRTPISSPTGTTTASRLNKSDVSHSSTKGLDTTTDTLQ